MLLKNQNSLALLSILLISIFSGVAHSQTNLTDSFKQTYYHASELRAQELEFLRQNEIVLIPGIMSESLVADDERTKIKLTAFLGDYFKKQLDFLNNKYRIKTNRLTASSKNVQETRDNILAAALSAKSNNKKVIFISHSLGGVALLDALIAEKALHEMVSGVIFLQSPFSGSDFPRLFINPPVYLKLITDPLLPLLNISKDTLEYLTPNSRLDFLSQNKEGIEELISKIPLFTVSSSSVSKLSILKPLLDLHMYGCLKDLVLNLCITPRLFHGPYDNNDGFVPLKSSFIPGADFIYLNNVDHIELVFPTYYNTYGKERFTMSILKMLVQKIHTKQ